MANTRVFEVNLSDEVRSIYAPFMRSRGLSGRAQTRVTQKIRNALRVVLIKALRDALREGYLPYRTGKSYYKMLSGVRAYGTTFANIRGHIVGPAFMKAHEEGATIRPKRAKYLAVPLAPALKADGSPKLPGPRSWGNIQNTFVFTSKKSGRKLIAFRNGRGGLTFLYVLVDEVELTKHVGWMTKAFSAQKGILMQQIGRAMLYEMGDVDLLDLARITHKGKKKKKRK